MLYMLHYVPKLVKMHFFHQAQKTFLPRLLKHLTGSNTTAVVFKLK